GLTTTVREGTSEGTLFLAAGHIRGTSLPGQPGNAAVAAHRDTLFSALGNVRMSDRIQFENIDGKYTYEVRTITVVKPDDVSVLKPSRTPELTLVTCYPFDYIGSAPDRFVVKARQVSQSPAKPAYTSTVQREKDAPDANHLSDRVSDRASDPESGPE